VGLAARATDRFYTALDLGCVVTGEFPEMLYGLLVDPAPPEVAERSSQGLTTVGHKYREHDAEYCKRLLPGAPAEPFGYGQTVGRR
jgi:hypothetical protein